MADGWQNRRLEVTYHEARSVLDAQQSLVADIDAKAMYSVRVIVVVVGIVTAAARIGGPNIFTVPLLVAGLGFLLLSLGLGVVTYAESKLYLGPNRSYIHQIVRDTDDTESWEPEFCIRMGDWIAENDDSILWNARLLFATQVTLFSGVTLLSGAVTL